MEEFKKDNSNFITINLHNLVNIKNNIKIVLNRTGEVLTREFVNLINTDVVKLIIDFSFTVISY